MELALVLLPGLADVRYHVHGEGVRCVYDAHGDRTTVELRVHPAPAEWRLGEEAGGGVRVHAALSAGTPVTLLLAAGSPEAASRAMAAAPHLTAHEARSAADADPAALDTLRPVTDVPDIDHGVAWATARTRLGLLRGVEGPPEGVFWAGLGALAVGDVVSGGAAVEALMRHGDAPVPWRLGEPVSALALCTLLAARLTLLSGDPSSALEARRLLPGGSSAWSAAPHAVAVGACDVLWGLALKTLAEALRHAAPDEEIRALRETAASFAGPRRRGGAIRLLMAGGPRPAPGADALGRLLAADGQPAPPSSQDDFLGAWALWGSPDPDAAWTAWRVLVARGLQGGTGPRGTWDAPAHPPGAAPEAGLLLCGFAHGLLGLTPDAPSGRIRIAPVLPSRLSAFVARGIRVGDASVEMCYRREGWLHTLRLEPLQGRVPVTVVLEPSLPVAPPWAVRVDGEAAALDAVGSEGRTRFRVQLVLDAPRTVEVEARPEAHPGG
jgi:hypothetical protein